MKIPLALGALILITACGSTATTTAVSRPSAEPPAGCSAALAVLPSSPPATAQQAADDVTALGGRKGTTLGAMLDQVAADASGIGMGLTTGDGSVADSVAAFKADAAAIRSYCA